MTEAEWLECTDPAAMLEFLQGKVSDRKLRLFACACCRRIWNSILDVRCRKAVDVMEKDVDGLIAENERREVYSQAYDASLESFRVNTPYEVDGNDIAASVAMTKAIDAAEVISQSALQLVSDPEERRVHSNYLRCIFGQPFSLISIDPRWLTSTVVDLAAAIYDERAFDRMPVLADSLMDAGCDSDEIINHCRGPGTHVRGCWVVDTMLGKE